MLASLSVDAEVFSEQAPALLRPELPQGGSQCVCVAFLLRGGSDAAGWKGNCLIFEYTRHVFEVHLIDQFKNLQSRLYTYAHENSDTPLAESSE